jgi:hypothetical protein
MDTLTLRKVRNTVKKVLPKTWLVCFYVRQYLKIYIIGILLLIPFWVNAQEDERIGTRFNDIEALDDGEIPNNTENQASTHPLGLLPNPIIRKDTRYTFEDLIWRQLDTSILQFHEYKITDAFHYTHTDLGIVGQNYRSLVFDPNRKLGFNSGFDAFEKYWYNAKNTKYYNTKVPFSSLYYNLGAATENNANAIHSQNISPYFNIAVDYRLTNAKGAFLRQKTLMHNLNINNWFNSKNHRYTLLFAFLFNRLELEENGGFDFDNLYAKENAGTERALVPVNLSNAANNIKNRGLQLKQIYFLGKKDSVQINDTTTLNVVQRKQAISYTFNMDSWRYKYTDTESNSDFYDGFYIDSTATLDSTRFWTAQHALRFENTPFVWQNDSAQTISTIRYFAALEYAYTKYRNLDVLKKWNNLFFSGGVASNSLKEQKIHYGINGKISLSPEAIGDFGVDGFLRWKINEMMHISAVVESKRTSATQKELEYRSNHYQWNNDFKPVFQNKLGLVFRCDHGDIDGELIWHNIQRFIYLDENAEFTQSNKNLNVLVFKASKAFNWKNFYLYNGITAQYISDQEQLHLPLFILKQSFHYQGGFFKGLLTANLGLDISYHTNYFGDNYNPALMDFYFQKVEKLKFYPVLDVFFEIQIKQARLFFVMEHVNQGMFSNKGYYVAPDYGAQDRAFKLGVSWQFFD